MEKTIERLLNDFFEETQMSIGIIDGSDIQFGGFIKEKGEIKKLENSSYLFEIGSITKVFTTYLLAQLALEKKINLHDEVGTYISNGPLKKSKITFLQLANHTSGLPRLPDNFYTAKGYHEARPYQNYDEACLIDYLNHQMKLEFNPGKKFSYSKVVTCVLGYIIAKIEGAPLEEVVKKRIFSPLGMESATFDISETGKEQLVRGLNQKGGPSNHWDGGLLKGCLGILSSVNDLTKFMLQIINSENPVSNLQTTKTYKISDDYFIGLGWGIRLKKHGITTYNHGGGSDGYSGYMKINRKDRKGIILLTNISAFHPEQKKVELLSMELMDRI